MNQQSYPDAGANTAPLSQGGPHVRRKSVLPGKLLKSVRIVRFLMRGL